MNESAQALRAAVGEHPAFPPAEHAARIARAQEAMRAEGIDVLLLFEPQSLGYFTGYTSVNMWDFAALLVPADGEPHVVLWEFEHPRFEVSATVGHVHLYGSHADPFPVLAEAVRALGGATYALDDWTPSLPVAGWERVAETMAGRDRRDARRVLWATRLRKSPAERRLLRDVAALTDAGVEAAVDALAEGVADHELAAAMSEAMLRRGSEQFSIQPIAAIGPRAGTPHSEAGGRRVRRGEGVFIELGGCRHRYTAPLMRTVVLGEPEPELAALAATGERAIETAVAAMRPGVRAADVARAAQAVIDADESGILFHRYFGYPVGFGVPPTWIENLAFLVHEGNPETLEEGMVFHIPLSLRHRGARGIGLSQTVEITADGPVTLAATAPRLIAKEG